jgi:hypothetical protein
MTHDEYLGKHSTMLVRLSRIKGIHQKYLRLPKGTSEDALQSQLSAMLRENLKEGNR